MNIFNFKLDFNPYMQYFCTKNCAMQILQYYNVSKPIQWLLAGTELKICKNPHHILTTTESLEIAPPNTYLVEGYSKKFEKSFEENCIQLSKGYIPIVLVDVFHLPYRNEYDRYHASHAVIMCGVNDREIQIIDYYPPHFYKGTVSLEAFKTARTSLNHASGNPFSGFPIKNQWYFIDKKKLTEDVRASIIEENISVLRNFASKQSDDMYFYGCEAIDCIILRINNKQHFEKNNDVSIIYNEIHNALFVFKNSILLMINYLNSFEQYDKTIINHFSEMGVLLDKINILTLKASITKKNINSELTLLLEATKKIFMRIEDATLSIYKKGIL